MSVTNKGHPVLLVICFCLIIALAANFTFGVSTQMLHMAIAIEEIKIALQKDEDVMKLSWCHIDSTTGKELDVVAEVSQASGESETDLQTRFEAKVTYLMTKYPPNCP